MRRLLALILTGVLLVAGAELLPQTLGGTARIAYEVAWGADLGDADGSGWTWTDITAEVRHAGPVSATIGRADELSAPPPARMVLVVDNPDGRWSPYNPLGSNWPHVKRGLPIRRRVTLDGSTWYTRWQGGVVEYARSSTVDGGNATVTITAAGVRQRLAQASAARAALTRSIEGTAPLAWWPLDDPQGSDTAVAATASTNPAAASDTVVFAGASSLPGGITAAPDMTAATAQLTGTVPSTTVTDRWQVEISALGVPAAAAGSATPLRWTTTGTWTRWDLILYEFGASYGIYVTVGHDPSSSDTAATYVMTSTPYDGLWHHYRVAAEQSGADTIVYLWVDDVLQSTHTLAAATTGRVNTWRSPQVPAADAGLGSVAHIAVYDELWADPPVGQYQHGAALTGYLGEAPYTRAARLCAEENVDLVVVDANPATDVTMGAQGAAAVMTLLDECATADHALLHDGLGPGLRWHSIAQRNNQAAALTVAATELDGSPAPIDNDQRLKNRATVTGSAGGSASHQDTTGDLGTAAVGVYEASVSINVATADQLARRARWEVHAGTVPGERITSLPVDVAAVASLAGRLIATANGLTGPVLPGWRVDVTGLSDVGPEHPTGTLDLVIEGWTEDIDPRSTWRMALNVAPQRVYDVFEVGDPDRGRVGTDGHTLAAPVPMRAGAELALNGTFEAAGVDGWSATAGTVVQSSAHAHTGTYAALLTATGGTQCYARPVSVAVLGGCRYRLTFWSYSVAGYAGTGVSVDWYDSGGGYLSTSSTTVSVPAATWTRCTVDVAAPASATAAQFGPTLTGTPSAGTALWVDDVSFAALLALATPTGVALWTTDAADFPLVVEIDGIPVTVTAISGSGSPQVATVDGTTVTKALTSGEPVRLYRNGVIRL